MNPGREFVVCNRSVFNFSTDASAIMANVQMAWMQYINSSMRDFLTAYFLLDDTQKKRSRFTICLRWITLSVSLIPQYNRLHTPAISSDSVWSRMRPDPSESAKNTWNRKCCHRRIQAWREKQRHTTRQVYGEIM